MWQPKKKKLQAKTTNDRLHKNFRGRLVADEMIVGIIIIIDNNYYIIII